MLNANYDFGNKACSKLPKSRKHEKERRWKNSREKGQEKKSQLALRYFFSELQN